MKLKTTLLSFTTLMLSLSALANPGPGSNENLFTKKNDINGNVYNASKKPISNVNITAYLSSKKEKVASTNVNGLYAFDDLKPGVYKFVFEKDGYVKVIHNKVILKTDEGFQLNVEMQEEEDFNFLPATFNFSNVE